MRNKDFYDKVHWWDMKINKSLQSKKYKKELEKDDPYHYFEWHYNGYVEYELLDFWLEGVSIEEIAESLIFIFNIESESKIGKAIYQRVKEACDAMEDERLEQVVEKIRRARRRVPYQPGLKRRWTA